MPLHEAEAAVSAPMRPPVIRVSRHVPSPALRLVASLSASSESVIRACRRSRSSSRQRSIRQPMNEDETALWPATSRSTSSRAS